MSEDTLSRPVLISGQLKFAKLTKDLSDELYAKIKCRLWMDMLNEGERPTKWLKPTVQGTKVDFDYIKSGEEYDQGLNELRIYIKEINEKFHLDYKIKKAEE